MHDPIQLIRELAQEEMGIGGVRWQARLEALEASGVPMNVDPQSPVAYPLGPPTISGTTITVDDALNQPQRITRDIADLTMQRFYMDRIFTPGGGVTGGATLFERPNALATDLYSDRDVKEVAPGEEFPILSFVRGVPMIARPRKIGGKWFITREARKRNDTVLLTRYMRQTANTIRRRIENMGLAELAAVITAESRFRTGTSWSAFAGTAVQSRTGTTGPVADLIAARYAVDLEERGHDLTGAILHPNQALSLQQAYPGIAIGTLLAEAGITEYFVTPRQTAGTVTLYEPGGVGVWQNEFPLAEETEDEGVASGGRQRTWYQWSISPLFAVVDQFGVMEVRGTA